MSSSQENDPKELQIFLSENTFIADNRDGRFDNAQQTVEFFAENAKYYLTDPVSQFKCMIFNLPIINENSDFRNSILNYINTYFNTEIKALELPPEKKYLIVYKISENELISKYLNIISERFYEYLTKRKKKEDFDEIKQKLMEDAAMEEILEKEAKQRFILPKVNFCEILEVSTNYAEILVPLYEVYDIIEKNLLNIENCYEKYKDTKLEYIIYLFNEVKNCYDQKIYSIKDENKVDNYYYKIKIEKLLPNKNYLFLIGVKFAKNYSIPTTHKFNFITCPKNSESNIFIYGDKNEYSNFLYEEKRIILPNNISKYSDCFKKLEKKTQSIFPLKHKDKIKNFDVISEDKSCLILNDGKVIQNGKTFSYFSSDEDDEFNEGEFPNNDPIKEEECKYENCSSFLINFFSNKIKIKKISLGKKFCLALSTNGECYSWGLNIFGSLGQGIDENLIIGNPKKIKFQIFDSNGDKNNTKNKPFFYDIATGIYSCYVIGLFNSKQVIYYWGNGAGVPENLKNIGFSNVPKILKGVENVKKIFAKDNSAGLITFDKDRKINLLYIFGTYKYGIDANFGIINNPLPVICNFFKDNGISVLFVNFNNRCMSVIGQNVKNDNKIEVYLRGHLTKNIFSEKEQKGYFIKLNKDWAENVISISAQMHCIFFLLKNGIVKKLWNKDCEESTIKIEGYDLNDYVIDDINKVKFESFSGDNFIIQYNKKNNE